MPAVCNLCGQCCRVIVLRWGPEEIAEKLAGYRAYLEHPDTANDEAGRDLARQNAESVEFILAHWRELGREEAEQRLPGMWDDNYGVYYTCDRFDEVTNRCTIHGSTPRICSGFPWYESAPGTGGMIHRALTRCSYFADAPPESRPVGWVHLLRRQDGELVPVEQGREESDARADAAAD